MSWRSNLRSTVELASRTGEIRVETQSRNYNFDLLLAQIGDRDAVVDACLPPQLAQDLRNHNVNAVWVPAVLGDGVRDEEIERLLLIGEGLIWESRKEGKVLLTRDVKFYRRLRTRAILVNYQKLARDAKKDSREQKRRIGCLRKYE